MGEPGPLPEGKVCSIAENQESPRTACDCNFQPRAAEPGYTIAEATLLTAEKVRAALEGLTPTQDKVDLAVKTAVETVQPSRVILFGSWPRGEAKWDSDLDMAVLMPDSAEPELGSIHRKLRRKLSEISMTIDLVVTTEGCASQFHGSINSIYHRILTQGQVAYEQPLVHAGGETSHQGR
jgi:predicted nucleotidyltransferase